MKEMAPCQRSWPAALPLMPRPLGRPFAEYAWQERCWVHATTGEPFSQATYRAGVLRRQAECERRRYWDASTGTRERRLQRTRREAAARPRKRRATQLTLDHVREGGATPKLTCNDSQARVSLETLHGHAQDSGTQLGG